MTGAARVQTPELIYESDALTAWRRRGTSPWTLVVFEGASFVGRWERLPRQGLFERHDLDAVVIMPKARRWYPAAETLPCVAAVRAAVGSARVVSYGSSMGGYGAIKFSRALGSDHVVALAPQFSIDPDAMGQDIGPWAVHFEPDRNFGMEIAAEDVGGRIDVVYDPVFRIDRAHAGRIAKRDGVRLTPIRNADHGLQALFGGPDDLLTLIGLLQADDLAGVAALARRNKRESVYFHYWLYLKLRRRKWRLAKWALRRAAALPARVTADFINRANALAQLGDPQGAYADLRRTFERHSSPFARCAIGVTLGHLCFGLGRETEALDWLRRAAALAPQDEEHQTQLALGLIRAGALDEAEAKLAEISARLDTPDAAYGLMQIHAARGRLDDAIAAGLRASTLRPAEARWRGEVGALMVRAGRAAEAAALLHGAARAFGGDAWLEWSRFLHDRGELSAALAAARHAVRLDPSQPDARRLLAVLLGESGLQAERADFALETARDRLGGAFFWAQAARALESLDRPAAAIAALREAVAANPADVQSHVELIESLLRGDRLAEAGEALREAEAACANPAPALVSARGQWRMRCGEVEQGLADLAEATALAPASDRAHGLLAHACLAAGRLAAAEASARRAFTLRDGKAWGDALAAALEGLGRSSEAIELLAARLADSPSDTQTRLRLARLLISAGRGPEAQRLAEAEGDPRLSALRAELLAAGGDVAGAAQAMRDALARWPQDAHSHGLLAHYCLRLRDLAGAEDAARAALSLDPRPVWLHAQLIAALESQSRWPEAAEACRRALDLAPGDAALAAKAADLALRL